MNVTLYSTGCKKCNIIKMKLTLKNIQFTLVEDQEKAVEVGLSHKIENAPILQVDENFYNFNDAIKWINER